MRTHNPAATVPDPTPIAVLLRHLATEFDHGAPDLYTIIFESSSVVQAQLNVMTPENLAAWGRILGVVSVKIDHRFNDVARNRYSVSSLYAGYQLEVWAAWSPDGEPHQPATSFIPLAELGRGFDDPPSWPLSPLETREVSQA